MAKLEKHVRKIRLALVEEVYMQINQANIPTGLVDMGQVNGILGWGTFCLPSAIWIFMNPLVGHTKALP